MNRLILCLAGIFSAAALAAEPDKLPEFATIEKEIAAQFQGMKDHQPADLITRDQATKVLDGLKRIGWDVADRDEILEQVLSEGNPLVKRLRTKAGKKFMRQSAKYPQAYDRLDRLERLPDGQQILKQLIEGPDGYKMIEYLTTSSGGKNLGKMLGRVPEGSNFNQTTGRIYTQHDLVERLKKSYAAL
jgi:hypothetical protein